MANRPGKGTRVRVGFNRQGNKTQVNPNGPRRGRKDSVEGEEKTFIIKQEAKKETIQSRLWHGERCDLNS